MKLANRVAIVTGAGSGIGRAIAVRFAEEGARVAVFDRDASTVDELTKEITTRGGTALTFIGSVDDPAVVEDAASRVIAQWSRVDALVTAAGISVGGVLTKTDERDWDRIFSVNVKGTFLWCKAVLPSMVANRSGSIVTISSQLALAGGRGNASYVASKGAVLSLTRSIALDYADCGVRANAIVPAAIETPMLERSFGRQADPTATRNRSLGRHPLGRFGRPEEVASAAVFLASDESSFTTGAMLPTDGGWLAA